MVTSLPYSTAKAGVIGFTRSLALEVSDKGITVNAISPGAFTKLFPTPNTEGPEFVAPLAAYLATDEAKDITGQVLYLRGGDLSVLIPPEFATKEADGFISKKGIWTIDELISVVPRLCKHWPELQDVKILFGQAK